jgi:hypothetical protein
MIDCFAVAVGEAREEEEAVVAAEVEAVEKVVALFAVAAEREAERMTVFESHPVVVVAAAAA